MPIHPLTPQIISRIAAGEVIERPASVVKELVENSLDAQASQITIESRGGGISLLRVADNGAGIPGAEVELAFQRYATSKIGSLEDLEAIATLGFRGEALPSIAVVSQVEMFTQTADEASGTFLSIKDGVVIEKVSRGRPPGTTVSVRNLLYNLPARRKFLKSWATENGHIAQVVSQYALAFPEVRFVLYLEGRPTLRTPGSGQLRDAVLEVYGLEVAQELLEVSPGEGADYLQVSGLAGPPSVARSSRSYISFFLNRRWIRSPLLAWAVEEAYRGLLPTGKHPIAIINLALHPAEVDVNVHPAKAEVRFRQEQRILAGVQKALRQALVALPVPAMEIAPPPTLSPPPSQAWLISSPARGEPLPSSHIPPLASHLPILRVLGQVASCYIIAEGPEGVYLIDQHAAHERVLLEKIQAQRQRQQVEVQGLLEPYLLEVTPQQQEALKEGAQALASYGFALEPFGERTYLVRSVPAILQGKELGPALKEVLDALAEGEKARWEERLAISLACHGAVRAGQVLSPEEMRELVRELERCAQPRTCPHGRPTMVHLSATQLDKEFGRH